MWARSLRLPVLPGRRVLRSDLIGGVLLLSVVAAGSDMGQFQGSNNPAQNGQLAQTGDPISIEFPKSSSPFETANSQRGVLRVNKTLVLVNVTVTDPLNRFITGLQKKDFRLFEDNTEQEITSFSSEDAPVSIGLVFDTSGSMGPKLQKSRQAAAEFLKIANPDDEFFLVQFNRRPKLLVPFTTDTDRISSALESTYPKGRTALLDAVYLAMHEMKRAKNARKALLIISDGGDNSSRYTTAEVKNAVREGDVQIFAMGNFESVPDRGGTPEKAEGPGLLNQLAQQTGGRGYAVKNVGNLPDIAAKIGIELRNEYILGYTPKNRDRDGRYRRVQVRLNQARGFPPLRPYFRLGYYAPTQ